MRMMAVPVVALAFCGTLLAAPVGAPFSPRSVDLDARRDVTRPVHPDLDGDGFVTVMDCNDDDPMVHPSAQEFANALDDDCNGVVDDGFDTTAEWPSVKVLEVLWPDTVTGEDGDWVSLATEPRIIRSRDGLAAIWTDLDHRLRLARLGETGGLLDPKPIVLRKDAGAAEIVWSGFRYGLVYEDLSASIPAVRLATLDELGNTLVDVTVAVNADSPRIAWGQDRFGVVWRDRDCWGNCLRFQRFDPNGLTLGLVDALPNSGFDAAVAFSGTGILPDASPPFHREGSFGIVYQAADGYEPSYQVWLSRMPLQPYDAMTSVRIDGPESEPTALGVRPSLGASPSGFAVCWHTVSAGRDGARARFLPLDAAEPIQGFVPDGDAGRDSRVAWTGSEFVAVNDNIVAGPPEGLDIHVRRLDASGNSHLAAGWGPWNELNLSDLVPGEISTNPDIANQGLGLAVIWVQEEPGYEGRGRIWFSFVVHR